jgi:hypothetical protein
VAHRTEYRQTDLDRAQPRRFARDPSGRTAQRVAQGGRRHRRPADSPGRGRAERSNARTERQGYGRRNQYAEHVVAVCRRGRNVHVTHDGVVE